MSPTNPSYPAMSTTNPVRRLGHYPPPMVQPIQSIRNRSRVSTTPHITDTHPPPHSPPCPVQSHSFPCVTSYGNLIISQLVHLDGIHTHATRRMRDGSPGVPCRRGLRPGGVPPQSLIGYLSGQQQLHRRWMSCMQTHARIACSSAALGSSASANRRRVLLYIGK